MAAGTSCDTLGLGVRHDLSESDNQEEEVKQANFIMDIGDITRKESMGIIRSRHQAWYERVRKSAANEVW